MKKILYTLLVSMFFISACDLNSIDDLEPHYKLTEDNVFVNAEKVESYLAGVYANWRYTGAIYHPLNISTLSGYYTGGGDSYESNDVDYEDSRLRDAYSGFYQQIQKVNFIIDNLSSEREIKLLTDKRRLEIDGEARLTRAMCHFSLLECFGQFYDLNSKYGIVLRLKASKELEAPARNTVKETYDAIIEDLDFAIKNAPKTSVHYKFSQMVAKAWKAKVLLYMGDHDESSKLALEVINDTNYSLESTYSDVFVNGYKSKEVLFAPFMVQRTEKVSIHNGRSIPANMKTLADAEAEGDANETTGEGFDKRYAFTHIEGLSKSIKNQKYGFISTNEGDQANTHFFMRLAEVYLIYAEAKARSVSGIDTDALAKMNALRTRAGMPIKSVASKSELLEAIRIEKVLELHNEMGQPWFDMVRYHKLGDLKIGDIKSTITDDHQLILPIPKEARAGNNQLDQNPGY